MTEGSQTRLPEDGREANVQLMPAFGRQPGFLLVCIGYLVAVVTASLVVNVLLIFWTGTVDGNAFLSPFAVGCAYTFLCALPGFIVTIIAARWLSLRNPLFFIVAGGLDSLLALWIFNTVLNDGNPLLDDSFAFFVFAGGVAGGLAYRLLAYRGRGRAA